MQISLPTSSPSTVGDKNSCLEEEDDDSCLFSAYGISAEFELSSAASRVVAIRKSPRKSRRFRPVRKDKTRREMRKERKILLMSLFRYSVLKDVMAGMICQKPVLLLLGDKVSSLFFVFCSAFDFEVGCKGGFGERGGRKSAASAGTAAARY